VGSNLLHKKGRGSMIEDLDLQNGGEGLKVFTVATK